ncbi:MAG: 16S rRNA (cytidine(1402)-2'-O)-methyltransferase [Pseudomonadota bacterium]
MANQATPIGNETRQGTQPSKLEPGLYVVATPIGNLGDLSERARMVLSSAEIIACEDSRVTGKLLRHLGCQAKFLPYHDHNAARVRPKLLAMLDAGGALALVTDAGTPCIADPGFKLVRAAHEMGVVVHAVPGPSAVIAALSVAGLPTDRFFFQGFLPIQPAKRRRVLASLAHIPGTLVFYETANRLVRQLEDCRDILGSRDAVILRELTKLYEETIRGTLPELVEQLAARGQLKGEIVVLVGPPPDEVLDDEEIDRLLLEALKSNGPSAAAADVAARSGRSRSALYKRALALQSAT